MKRVPKTFLLSSEKVVDDMIVQYYEPIRKQLERERIKEEKRLNGK